MDVEVRGQVTEVFEKAWSELCDEYAEKREKLNFYSEHDLQVHLAKKLLDGLPSGWTHVEVPLRLGRIKEWKQGLFCWGRPVEAREKGALYEVDIAIIDTDEGYPCLLSELKYKAAPVSLDYLGTLLRRSGMIRDEVQRVKKGLMQLLQGLRGSEIRRQDFSYFMSNVGKLSAALKELRILGERVQGYLCVIDELYFNAHLEEELKRAVREYDPEIKVLVEQYSIEDAIKDTLNRLEI